jgi:hypothetical protein
MIVLGCFFTASYANVISVSFWKTGNPPIQTNVFTGVVSDLSWAEVSPDSAGTYNFSDLDGSTLDVQTTAPLDMMGSNTDWWYTACFTGLRADNGSDVTITLSDIPYDNYYVIVYLSGWGSPYKGAYSDGMTTYYADFLSVTPLDLVQSSDTDSSDGYDAGSYVVFGSESGPLSGTSMTITATKFSGAVGIGGIQVVEVVPEPTSVGLFIISGTGLLLARQQLRK